MSPYFSITRTVRGIQFGCAGGRSGNIRFTPTILREGPYRFYFYSHEPNEPPHVHVDRDDLSAKSWLDAVSLARNFGFGE
jgi:hypothetical protein